MSGLRELIDAVEAFAGAFLGTCLAVCIALMPLLGDNPLNAMGLPDGVYVLSVVVSTIVLEGRYVWRLWATLGRGEFPLGPAVAGRSTVRWRWLRPTAAIWWFAHFFASVFGIVVVASLPEPGDMIGIWVSAMMAVGIGIGGNVYLALGIKALTFGDVIVERWWKHRFLLDVAVAVFALTFVSMMQ